MRDKIADSDGQTEFVIEFRRRSLFTRSGLAAAPAVMAGRYVYTALLKFYFGSTRDAHIWPIIAIRDPHPATPCTNQAAAAAPP